MKKNKKKKHKKQHKKQHNKQYKKQQTKNMQKDILQKDGEETRKAEGAKATEQIKAVKGTKKKIIFCGALMMLAVLLIVIGIFFGRKVAFYQNHYFPNTFINSMECSESDAETVAVLLNQQAQEYSLQIMGRDEDGNPVEIGVIQAEKIRLNLEDSLSAANDVLAQQNEWLWLKTFSDAHYSYNIAQGVVFDEELVRAELESFEACQKKNMVAPTDAHIGDFSEQKGVYELVPETKGTQLDMDAVMMCVCAAIYGDVTTVDLVEQGCYVEPNVTVEDQKLLANLEEVNQWLQTKITYDWNGFEVIVDTDVVKEWVSVKNNKPILSEEAVQNFVNENAEKYDTYGKIRKFMTTLGVELSLPSGAFGWKTDCETEAKELVQLIKKGSVLNREPIYSSKAPRKGISDIGSSYVEADLTNQHLYLYHKGNLVLETDFVSGDMNVPGNITPQGVFGLTYKTMNAVLRGADYVTPVTYWMPFHGNFGMHDATWRTEFGGDIYMTGGGSHGCLNLPLDKAAEIYNYMYEGHPIICYYY